MYRNNVENVTIFRIRFNDFARTIHTQYRGIDKTTGRRIGWSEKEDINTDEEWFERKLKGE